MWGDDWTVTSLGEVAACRNGAGIKRSFFADAGVPLVRVSNFTEDSVHLANCVFVDSDHARIWSEHRLDEDDILVATVGSWPPHWSSVVGKVIRVPRSAAGAIQNQNTARVLADPRVADQRFLYYLLRTKKFAHWAANAAQGSANQARLAVRNLEGFRFRLPPLPEQRAIAGILGTLDDKIELSRQMNQTLESIARAIFKSWFVDFDPVWAKMDGEQPFGMDVETAALFPDAFVTSELGPIPEGWSVQPVGEIAAVVGGGTPSTRNPEYWDGGTHFFATPKDLSALSSPVLLDTERKVTNAGLAKISSGLLPIGTVLLSSRAPIGYLAIAAAPVCINQGFIAMVCNGPVSNYYVLNWTQTYMPVIKQQAGGTTFAEISKRSFRPLLVLLPSGSVMRAFNDAVEPLYAMITHNLQEARTLSDLREALLPKVISGKMRVPGETHLSEVT
jgi:type I restriction enzyme S subunit